MSIRTILLCVSLAAGVPELSLRAAGAVPALSLAQNQEQTKAKLDQETDPFDRAKLQIRLAGFALDEARKQYDEASVEKGLKSLQEMLKLVEDAQEQLFGTGNNPRKKPKGFKEAEIKLRELSRRLEDLRLSLPTEERGELEKIAARLVEIRDKLLHGLMSVKGKK